MCGQRNNLTPICEAIQGKHTYHQYSDTSAQHAIECTCQIFYVYLSDLREWVKDELITEENMLLCFE